MAAKPARTIPPTFNAGQALGGSRAFAAKRASGSWRALIPRLRSCKNRHAWGKPMHNMALSLLRVVTRPGMRSRGVLIAGRLAIPVVLGRTGIRANKREGDGATPRGRFRLRRLWWRADRRTR